MRRDFTDYLASLDDSGEPPSRASFDRLWAALRRALRSELKRRGLWSSPPRYVGVVGHAQWGDGGWAEGAAPDDALEELTADCYQYIFLTRFQSLRAQLAVRPAIEGLVFRNIRNFLYELQRHHDPLGFRTFDLFRETLEGAIADGRWHVLSGEARIANDTVVGVTPHRAVDDGPPRLAELVAPWGRALLPELAVTRAGDRRRLIERLGGFLDQLAEQGVDVFRVGDLVEILKTQVRLEWAAFLTDDLGESAVQSGEDGAVERVPIEVPAIEMESRDSFRHLQRSVLGRLRRQDNPKTREYLERLWLFLCARAASDELDRPLSARAAAAATGIPRERLPGLYRTLRNAIDEHGAADAAKTATGAVTLERGR